MNTPTYLKVAVSVALVASAIGFAIGLAVGRGRQPRWQEKGSFVHKVSIGFATLDRLDAVLLRFEVEPASRLSGVEVAELRLPPGSVVAILTRGRAVLVPEPASFSAPAIRSSSSPPSARSPRSRNDCGRSAATGASPAGRAPDGAPTAPARRRPEADRVILTSAALAVFIVAYALIATERVHRVAAALGGVAGMVVIGLVDAETAFFDEHTGVDWNVIFLLFGMMIIVGVLKQTGLFEFLALWAAKKSGGHPYKLLVLLVLVGAAVAPILDNVTCVLLVAPVTLSVCPRLELPSAPYLISLILASNIGGMSTLIGDPPNIIIGSRAGLSFTDFLVHSLPLTSSCWPSSWSWRAGCSARTCGRGQRPRLDDLRPADAITNVRMLRRSLVVLFLVMSRSACTRRFTSTRRSWR